MISRRLFVGGLAASGLIRPALGATWDVVVYGGTLGGVFAACAAAREGVRVCLVLGDNPLGGLTANGLSHIDCADSKTVGGMALAYVKSIGALGSGAGYTPGKPCWSFEPSVALKAAQAMIAEYAVPLIAGRLAQVWKSGAAIQSITLSTGAILSGKVFVDASYEGDLMAGAGCGYTWGREAEAQYGESNAGYGQFPQIGGWPSAWHPTPGVLPPGFNPAPNLAVGAADRAVACYCYRVCLSNDPTNMVPWYEPAGYDPGAYAFELARRGAASTFTPGAGPNSKFDWNFDYPGASWGWPNGTPAQRQAIALQHFVYQMGWAYFFATDPRVPSQMQDEVRSYGLAADEFTGNDNWPLQIYAREGRRLCGVYVMTQADCTTAPTKADSIGEWSYSFDSHPTQYLPDPANSKDWVVEGTIPRPMSETVHYRIPYRCMLPQQSQATNLLVSTCLSSSHVAWCSLRMELVFGFAGEAAGIAAGLAVRNRQSVSSLTSGMSSIVKSYGGVV